jgi:hypothetical protein
MAYVIAILAPPSVAVTVCGVLCCCCSGFLAGLVPTLLEASGPMALSLRLSFGRWALQCLAADDFRRIQNAFYADVGAQLTQRFGWPADGACDAPIAVLLGYGFFLRACGALALVLAHRDRQHKPPLCGSRRSAAAQSRR